MNVPLLLVAGSLVLLPPADSPKSKSPTAFAVPYKLTDTKHILVRVKLNGQGPYNLFLDTGAPAVFVTKAVAKKAGLKEDDDGWAKCDTFAMEGGLSVPDATCRVADLFQLEGMNGLGMAGVEVHGVVGYNVLAKYRITYDMTKDKLEFVQQDGFTPMALKAMGGKGGKNNSQGTMDVMGPLAKTMAGFMGLKPDFTVKPSGFLGVEFEQAKTGLVVKAVLKGSPAAVAGLQPGDTLESLKNGKSETKSKLQAALDKANIGDTVEATVLRDGKKITLTIELGKGL